MSSHEILLPSKPRLVKEDGNKAIYEIDGLYPGYGHTLGNSLRRIILSSLPGAAITKIKIDGVGHEFETLEGVQEDVINVILNLKRVRFKLLTDESQIVTLSAKEGVVTAKNLSVPGQVEILNEDEYIATVTDKKKTLNIELTVEKGLGFIQKDEMQKEKMELGQMAIDAIFSPIRRVSYEVENMRVGDNTNHNRLRVSIETDGTYTPKEALERAVEIMILQLQSIHEFKGLDEIQEEMKVIEKEKAAIEKTKIESEEESEDDLNQEEEMLKTRVEDLNLSTRTQNALDIAKIRTVGGIARKSKEDLLALEGLGEKGIQEIKRALSNFGILLK
ncbi:DNA-directed RNA polymerase subunit alpha [Candidatus Parcubacteria bacterium]|nr:DNA-directed RNA polymerase subunit alpha [Candidatus Parcubacteria bacterium]